MNVIKRSACGFAVGAIALGAALLPARADYQSSVLADRPALYLRFSESGVAPPVDNIATNLGTFGATDNGAYSGNMAVMKRQSGPFSGSFGTAFDGTGQNVGIAFDPNMNPASGVFSVEAWVQPALAVPPSGQSSLAAVLSCGTLSNPRSGWLIYQANGGWNLRMYNQNTTATSLNITGGGNPTPNAWTHLAATYDGTTARVYVNGVQVASGNPTGATTNYVPNASGPFRIGTRSDVAFNWQGSASEAAYYTTVLSAGTIAAHFAAASTNAAGYAAQISGDGPVGYWRLNEPVFPLPVAANAGALGATANGSYHYWSSTATDLDSPGFAGFEANNTVLETSGTNGIVTVPPLNLNTNTVTFECWMKRSGAQSSYAGVLFHRGGSGTATGLDFNGTSSNLGYHWSDQANTYNWVSGLMPPDGVWTYVALAVAPSQAVMYMYDGTNWSSAINVVDHPVQAFGATTHIGSDSDSSRFYTGLLDEAAIYGQTLTEGQLRTHALGGFGGTNAPVLITDPPAVTPVGTVYSTTPFTIVADAYGQPPLSFQWIKDGTNLPGATTVTYGKISTSTNDAGNYSVIVTNAYGAVTSLVASVIVSPAVPPTITQQPVPRSAYLGGAASFTVIADGTPPLSYQWTHAGTNVPAATNATIVITGVDATKTGAYAVTVTNVAGRIPSSSAALTIITPAAGSYVEAVITNGPVNYWRLDEAPGSTTALDSFGGLDGTYSGGVTLGIAGGVPLGGGDTAAEFDGASGQIVLNAAAIPAPWTAIFWAKRTDPITPSGALIDDRISPVSASLRLEQWQNTGKVGVSRYGGFGDIAYNYSAPSGSWVQLVFVGRTNGTDLYVNGLLTDSTANSMPLPRRKIGASTSTDFLKGQLDEVALYDKALSASTIATIYAAGAFGSTTAPFIVRPPASTTIAAGSSVTFSVGAAGSLPLAYQWLKGGTPIPGATTTSYTLPSAYFTDAGSYSVQVTNLVNSVTSAAATLTVLTLPTFANLTNGLVLHLKFEATYLDSSGRTNDATAIGTPTFIAGRLGQAVHLSTAAAGYNYLTVSDLNGDLSFDVTNSFSVSLWLRYTTAFNDLPIIGNAINSTYQKGWVLTEDGGKVDWTLVGTDVGQTIADPAGGPLINDGVWHQIVVVFDRSRAVGSTFVDGIKVDSRSISGVGSLITGNTLTLGQDPTGAYAVFGAFDLDDLGIWRRALSDYEAASIYAAGQLNQSFDVYGPVKVYVNHVGANVDVSWQAGSLLQSTSASGPYTPVSGATAPFYRTTAGGSAMFFRVQQ